MNSDVREVKGSFLHEKQPVAGYEATSPKGLRRKWTS